jgi:hypothetical protein
MPAHDWTRVDDGIFHAFHLAWIGILQHALNAGLLPPDYYALGEQVAGGIGPDVLTLHSASGAGNGAPTPATDMVNLPGTVAVAAAPPQVRLMVQASQLSYTTRQRSLVIHHVSDHRIVALIEVVSPGNKASRYALRSFVNKALAALAQGIHLLIIDLHPPGPRDPQGIHGVIWEELTGQPYEQPPGLPLTLVAYSARVVTAYVEPLAVDAVLPEMPLFLDPEQYIKVPLETTYQGAYAGIPRLYRDILER